MRHYKDIKALEKRLEGGPNWEDDFKIGGRVYTMYEYGPGPGVSVGYDYIYFLNKRSGEMVYIRYDCPSYQYVDGQRVQTKAYRLHFVEHENWRHELWR